MRCRVSILSLVVLAALQRECNGEASDQENSDAKNAVCQTEECKEIGRRLTSIVQHTTDPCNDFYEHVCGQWPARNRIPKFRDTWSERIKHLYVTRKRLRGILKEAPKPTDIEPVKMAKAWYRSCMDLDAIEAAGLQPLTSVLDSYGGWPIAMENWTGLPENLSWQALHKTYRRLYDVNALYHVYVKPDSKNSTRLTIAVDQTVSYPLFSALDETEKEDNSVVGVYSRVIENVVKQFVNANGANVNGTKLSSDVFDMLLFTIGVQRIVNASPKDEFEVMTISELQTFYDSANSTHKSAIDWVATIKGVLQGAPQEINENTSIEVKNKAEMHLFRKLIDNTPIEQIVNYIHWGFVSKYMRHTNKAMRDLDYRVKRLLSAVKSPEPRWVTCIVDLQLQNALSYAYVKKYGSQSAVSNVTEMMGEVKKEMLEHIQNANWLSDEDKEFINGKFNNVKQLIGYSNFHTNASAVTDLYKGLSVGSKYFENYVRCLQFEMKSVLKNMNEPFDKYGWMQQPTIVNAFYYSQANSIIVPMAEFQEISFALSTPPSVKFGSIGFLIGHELSHAFLYPGHDYDKYGNQITSGQKVVGGEYNNKVNCYVKQYNQYVLSKSIKSNKTIYLNGDLTKDENIADNVGLQISYDAYRKHVAKSIRPLLKLPGLEKFTDEKLFFMIFAAEKCERTRSKFLKISYNVPSHAPWKHRVNGALKNMKAFASTFNCPVNSPMNPADKCDLV